MLMFYTDLFSSNERHSISIKLSRDDCREHADKVMKNRHSAKTDLLYAETV